MITPITQQEINQNKVASLPARPNASTAFGGAGYTSLQLRQAFDRLPLLLAARYNALVEAISASGEEGLAALIPTDIEDAEGNIYSLKDLLSHIKDGTLATYLKVEGQYLDLALKALAPLDSPSFLGNPTATTPSLSEQSNRIATTEWVKQLLGDSNTSVATPNALRLRQSYQFGEPLSIIAKRDGNGIFTFEADFETHMFNRKPAVGELFVARCKDGEEIPFLMLAEITDLHYNEKGQERASFKVVNIPMVDQVFQSQSENPQSGKAVTEALVTFMDITANQIIAQFNEAKHYTDQALANLDATVAPDYVKEEAERVADQILAKRNANSFVMALAGDLHTNGGDQSAASVLHASQGMNEIASLTQLDLIALLGDYEVYCFDDGTVNTDKETEDARQSLKYVKKIFSNIAKGIPFIQLQGNHDKTTPAYEGDVAQACYAYIGANNVGTVTDYANKHRIYGYRDFDNYKIRVIYLNTADVSDHTANSEGVSQAQLTWLENEALHLSDSDWGMIVLTHHPLNWYAGMNELLNVLDQYKGKGEGAKLIAHFHGHIHNFRVETLGTNGVVSITIPNACFGRENEYGTSDSYSEDIRKSCGDTDKDGNQRKFEKTANTGSDTSFNVVVVDRENERIHCINYGAGIDRIVCFNGTVWEEGEEPPTAPDEPDTPDYTNLANPYADGWVTSSRMSSDGTAKAPDDTKYQGNIVTNYIYIPVAEKEKELYVKGLDLTAMTHDNTAPAIGIYSLNPDGSYTWIANRYMGQTNILSTHGDVTVYHVKDKVISDGGYWLRFTATLLDGYSVEDVVITLGEPITA